jgi:hypothetical protein
LIGGEKVMGFRRSNSILLVLLLFFIGSLSNNRAQHNEKKPSSPRTVLFAVTGGDEITIDPIVILDRGRYVAPPDGVHVMDAEASKFDDTPVSTRFVAKYYRPNQIYQLLFGGGKVGTATVVKRASRTCISLAARVRLQTSIKVDGWVMALATNSNSLGFQEISRRALLPDERSAVLNLVRRTYRQRSVPAELFNKITVTNLTGVDLDRDGNAEIIGSFRIEQGEKAYLLFLIIGKRAGTYKIELQHYGQALESGEDFVDQLDVDGNGIGEVITQVSGYETWGYAIYKKRAGKWQRVYRGGGGGC